MHVLLTGASGFLGSAFVGLLGCFPEIELSVLRSSHAECVLPLGSRELFVQNLEAVSGIEKVLGARVPTHIIHLAALSSPAACEQQPKLAHAANVGFTRTLVQLASKLGCHITVASTDLVFEGSPARAAGFSESDTPSPRSAYSRSKADAESAALLYARSCVVRLCLLYGHTHSKSRGALGWIEDKLHSKEELVLFEDEYRTPIHVADAAHALLQLARRQALGVWHCGGPERLSRVQFGLTVAEALGYDPSVIRPARRADVPSTPERPEDVSLSSDKLWTLLGAVPRTLRTALVEE